MAILCILGTLLTIKGKTFFFFELGRLVACILSIVPTSYLNSALTFIILYVELETHKGDEGRKIE